jgi:hypothetical protein
MILLHSIHAKTEAIHLNHSFASNHTCHALHTLDLVLPVIRFNGPGIFFDTRLYSIATASTSMHSCHLAIRPTGLWVQATGARRATSAPGFSWSVDVYPE